MDLIERTNKRIADLNLAIVLTPSLNRYDYLTKLVELNEKLLQVMMDEKTRKS